jgi:hypothetical protein
MYTLTVYGTQLHMSGSALLYIVLNTAVLDTLATYQSSYEDPMRTYIYVYYVISSDLLGT